MEDLIKNARKHLSDIEIEKIVKDLDLDKINADVLKNIDFEGGARKARKQLSKLDIQQQREDEAEGRGFVGGVLLGAIIGAVLALIFAPKSGAETRQLVSDTASELTHKAEDAVKSATDDGPDEQIIIEQDAPVYGQEPAIEREIVTDTQPKSSYL